MSASRDLEALVFGDERPDLDLTTKGEISSSWCEAYERALDAALRASNRKNWSRDLVQAAHFVSFYLPLRCKVAAPSKTVTVETSTRVFDLHVLTERKLWADLAAAHDANKVTSLAAEHPLSSPEDEIVRLSLGAGNPATFLRDEHGLEQWNAAFRNCWKAVEDVLKSSDDWDKWTVTAARVASFYWDLPFSREVVLVDSSGLSLPSLNALLPSPTIALISVMLNPPSSAIDDSGLPMIGENRLTAQFSVRRVVEASLMKRVVPSIEAANSRHTPTTTKK